MGQFRLIFQTLQLSPQGEFVKDSFFWKRDLEGPVQSTVEDSLNASWGGLGCGGCEVKAAD